MVNFKNLITKSLPNKQNTDASSIFGKFFQRLTQIKLDEFNQDEKVTPQIINMTTSIDHMLNEILAVFSHLIDELVNANYSLVEKEHELSALRQLRPMSGSLKDKFDNLDHLFREKEEILAQKEEKINQMEHELGKKETELKSIEFMLSNQEEKLKEHERKLCENESDLAYKSRVLDQELEKIKAQKEHLNKEKHYLSEKMKLLNRESTNESIIVYKNANNQSETPLLAPNNSLTDLNQVLKPQAHSDSDKDKKYDEIQQKYKELEFKYEANSLEFQKQIE